MKPVDALGRWKPIHGHGSSTAGRSPTYRSWTSMKSRCNNPNNTRYADYGGAGVKVCKRWFSFVNFLADMGERPTGTTLGRFGDTGDYKPSNCSWQTRSEQAVQKRRKYPRCRRGHLRIPENTKVSGRGCRLCRNDQDRRRRHATKVAKKKAKGGKR